MNTAAARERMLELVGDHVAPQLTTADATEALARARTPDTLGRAPGTDGWIETVDPYWAAAEAVTMLATRTLGAPQLAEFTAEGASFKLAPAALWDLARTLRSQSMISQHTTPSGDLGVIELDTTTGYQPTSGGWPSTRRPDLDWS